jgi:hypothetical protein
MRACKGNALIGALAGLLLAAGTMMASASGQARMTAIQGPISGTITRMNLPTLRLHLRTDDDRTLDLTVVNVDAMRAVRRGEHVRVDLDDRGIVLNIDTTLSPPRPMSFSRG